MSASHLFGSAPAVAPWRYWLCDCESTTFEDGFELPSGFTVLPDDTVHLSDGSVIRRDGVLERADGKLVLADGSVTGPAASPPGAPTGVAAFSGDGKAVVSFDPPAAGGLPITSYTVTAEPGGYVYTGASSPIAAIGLTNGTHYTFTVTARNGAGPGPASAPSAAVAPLAVPEPPTGVERRRPATGSRPSASRPPRAPASPTTRRSRSRAARSSTAPRAPSWSSGLTNGDSYTFR